MKKSIRVLALIMCAVMLLTAAPICASAATEADLSYEIDYESEVTITGCAEDATGELVIPAEIEGYPVTTIDYAAFRNCDKITSIVLPETVSYINSYAFEYCKGLKYLKFPADAYLSYSVFNGVSYASKITVDTDFVTIEWTAGVDETTIVIGKDITNLGILDDVDDIIGKVNAIQLADGNEAFKLIDGVLYDANVSFLCIYPSASANTSYVMPSTVLAFDSDMPTNACPGASETLENITFSKKLFGGILEDEGVTYEDLLNAMGGNEVEIKFEIATIFSMYLSPLFPANLVNINVEQGNVLLKSKDGILYDASEEILIKVPAKNAKKDITIPGYIPTAPISALVGCRDLSVTISDEFTENVSAMLSTEGFTEDEFKINYAYTMLNFMSGFTANSFSVSASNEYLSSEDGVLYNKDKTILVKYPITRRDLFYKLPETVDVQISFIDATDAMMFMSFGAPAFTSILIDLLNLSSIQDIVEVYEAITYPAQITVHISDEQAAAIFANVSTNPNPILGIPNICVETITPEIEAYNKMIDDAYAEWEKQLAKIEKEYADGNIDEDEYKYTLLMAELSFDMVPRVFCCNDNHKEFDVYDNENGYITASNIKANYKSTGKIDINAPKNTKVTFTSSNEDIVEVSADGSYKIVGEGTATITVTIDGTDLSDTVEIKASYAWWQWIIRILFFGFIWY